MTGALDRLSARTSGRRAALADLARGLSFVVSLAACEPPPRPAEPAVREPRAPHVEAREQRQPLAPEPASVRTVRLGRAPFIVESGARPLAGPGGRWFPGTGADALFTQGFMRVDEQAYWIQPTVGGEVLRISRDRGVRRVRGGFDCPGWLLGERDDLLWCADVRDGDNVEIRVIDKSGFGSAALAATLPGFRGSSLNPSLDLQGPLIVGERVVMAVDTGFVSAELEGDGAALFIELGQRPECVVARGQRLAWRVKGSDELYSGVLPLSTIRREYVHEGLLGCPAWAGGSLLVVAAAGETMTLLRLTADGGLFALEAAPVVLGALVSDSERAWWLVRGHGLWWIDAASHGRVDTAEIFPYTIAAEGGLLAWETDERHGRAIHVSEVFGGSITWL